MPDQSTVDSRQSTVLQIGQPLSLKFSWLATRMFGFGSPDQAGFVKWWVFTELPRNRPIRPVVRGFLIGVFKHRAPGKTQSEGLLWRGRGGSL
jgi:hypothetical protein